MSYSPAACPSGSQSNADPPPIPSRSHQSNTSASPTCSHPGEQFPSPSSLSEADCKTSRTQPYRTSSRVPPNIYTPSFHQNPTESLRYTHHLTMTRAYVRHPPPNHVPTPVMLHVHPNHHAVTQRVRAHHIPDIYRENSFGAKTGNFFGGKTCGVHVNALARPHRLVLSHPPAAHSAPLAEPQRRSPRTCPASTFSHGSQHPAAARTQEGDSPRLSTRAV